MNHDVSTPGPLPSDEGSPFERSVRLLAAAEAAGDPHTLDAFAERLLEAGLTGSDAFAPLFAYADRTGQADAFHEVYDTVFAGSSEAAVRARDPHFEPFRPEAFQEAGPIPQSVYDALPRPLRRVLAAVRAGSPAAPYRADVVLTAALPTVAACLPGLTVRYDQKWQPVSFFTTVVAESGAGKGAMDLARHLARPLDDALRQESDRLLDRYEAAQDDAELMRELREERTAEGAGGAVKRPPYRRVFVAGNASAAALFDAIYENDGRALLFETEVRTLSATLKQDWGNLRPQLLDGFHGEPMSEDRKGHRPKVVRRPSPNLALSGTEGSFSEWIADGGEDGMFNRTLWYTFRAGDEPFTARVGDQAEDEALEAALADCGDLLRRCHEALERRMVRAGEGADVPFERKPLPVRLAPHQVEALNAAMRPAERAVAAQGFRHLKGLTNRYGFLVIRLSGLLAVLRLADRHGPEALSRAALTSVTATDEDFGCALRLVMTYLGHAVGLAHRMPRPRPGLRPRPTGRARRLLDALPQHFALQDAYAAAAEVGAGIPPRTVRYYLTQAVEAGLLDRMEAGSYGRTAAAPPAQTPRPAGPAGRAAGRATPTLVTVALADAALAMLAAPSGDGAAPPDLPLTPLPPHEPPTPDPGPLTRAEMEAWCAAHGGPDRLAEFEAVHEVGRPLHYRRRPRAPGA